MASFLMHVTIPFLFLLAWRFDVRKVLWLWPLSVLPDLDYFFGLHRALTVNAFILLPGLVGLWRDPKRREWWLIATLYLASHVVMDVFDGGVALLYPITTYTTCISAGVNVVTATNTVRPYWEDCSYGGEQGGLIGEGPWNSGTPPVYQEYAWMVPHEVGILTFLLPTTAVLLWRRWREQRDARALG